MERIPDMVPETRRGLPPIDMDGTTPTIVIIHFPAKNISGGVHCLINLSA